jgi:hypothetical protein
MITTFEVVETASHRAGKCSKCGKRTSRTVRFWQTLNPFNTGGRSRPKTREEIVTENRAARAAYDAKPFTCVRCDR